MDPIVVSKQNSGDLFRMLIDAIGSVQYKLAGFVFAFFILISTDMFIHRVLRNIPDTMDGGQPTSWGVTIQGMFLALAMIIFDALIKMGVV